MDGTCPIPANSRGAPDICSRIAGSREVGHQSPGRPCRLSSDPGKDGLSEALREMVAVADTEEWEGKKQAWTGILDIEFSKARHIQTESIGLKNRGGTGRSGYLPALAACGTERTYPGSDRATGFWTP